MQNAEIWTTSVVTGIESASAQIGGYSRGSKGPSPCRQSLRRGDCAGNRLLSLHIYTSQPYAEMLAHSRVADVVRSLFLWSRGGDEGIADADQGSLGLGRPCSEEDLLAGWGAVVPAAAESGPLAGGTVDYGL